MSTEEQVRRKARVLAAFMSQAEAMGFASSFALEPQAFVDQWRARASARGNLATGYVAPRVEDVPASAAAHLAQLQRHPAFPILYKGAEFKMVELGKLVAFQHWMDTDVSDGVHGAGNSGTPAAEDVLRKCLPAELVPASRTWTTTERFENRISIATYSHNNTLGFEHAFDPSTGSAKFQITAAPNLMLVVEHSGRYILMNGYHRAWWLRSRGVEMVPVALQRGAGIAKPGFIQPDVLLGDRPPLVDHFLDETISMTADVRSMLRVVRISAEVSFVPRLL